MKRKPNPILPAKERLERNLENLAYYCNPGFIPGSDVAMRFLTSSVWPSGSHDLGYWPSPELLAQIEHDATVLAERGRVRQIYPVWKAFEQVDRRLTKLRLKLRVSNLISRAGRLLSDESELNKALKLAFAGYYQAQGSLDDRALKARKFVKLLEAHREMERRLCMAEPLARWTVWLGHPMAKDFVCIAEFDPPGQDWRDSHRRILQWDRTRRHRLAKKTSLKSVTPI